MIIAWEPNCKRPVYGYPTGLTVARYGDGLDYLAVIFQTNFGEWIKPMSQLTAEQQMWVRKALQEESND